MSSRRWTSLLDRFFSFIIERLPKRDVIVATDATGYSGRKRVWRETPYARRPNEDWVKTHAAIEVDRFLILSYELTASNVHDSQVFSGVWERLPKNVAPTRSLADSAYHDESGLAAARLHGATPLHKIKKNARGLMEHRVNYNKLVFFAKQFPQRFAALTAKRNHAETVFSMRGDPFGHRIRCRKSEAREKEVRCKLIMFDLHQFAVTGLAQSL
jgi:transposase